MTRTDRVADAELVHLFERMCAAWSSGDADGYGACFTEDSDYVSYDGTHARGRRDMVANHDRLFRGVLTGSALVGEVESVRHLREDVAVMHATGSVQMPWRRTGSMPAVGSSMKSTSGLCTSAQASSSRRCIPPDRSRASRCLASVSSTTSSARRMSARRRNGPIP